MEQQLALTDMPGHLIRRLNQISTTVFQQRMQEAGFDLTPVQFSAMQVLQDKTDIEQAQIAALIAYDRATIGGVIDRLEKKGYVSRVVSKQDRRARLCRLTSQGREIIGKVMPIVEALQSEILNGLSQDEREQFIALARKSVLHNQANDSR
jgi:DNA-binding MarR family transcriptional regulator